MQMCDRHPEAPCFPACARDGRCLGDDLKVVVDQQDRRNLHTKLALLTGIGVLLIALSFVVSGCSRQETSSVDAESVQLQPAPLVELAPGLYWDEVSRLNYIVAGGLVVAAEPSDGRPLRQRIVGVWRRAEGDTSESPFGPTGQSQVTEDEDSDDEGLEPTGTASYEPSRGLPTRVIVRWPFEDELSEEDLEILEQIHPGCI